MKIFDLRKYIFANITAFIGYVPIIAASIYNMYPHAPFNPDDFIDDGIIIVFVIAICAQTVLFTFPLTLLEIIVRKFIIEKKFPNFNINYRFKFELPKFLSVVYNFVYAIIFYFGILVSSLLFIAMILIIAQ